MVTPDPLPPMVLRAIRIGHSHTALLGNVPGQQDGQSRRQAPGSGLPAIWRAAASGELAGEAMVPC